METTLSSIVSFLSDLSLLALLPLGLILAGGAFIVARTAKPTR